MVCIELLSIPFNPIKDELFQGCSRNLPPSLKIVTHTCNDQTSHNYTLSKEHPKLCKIHDTTLGCY